MLRSSQVYFVPDDVCVPCRVRHSETASGDNREFTVLQEMMCTMRVWQKTREQPPPRPSAADHGTSNNRVDHSNRSSHRRSLSSPFDSASLRIPASEFRNTGPELVLTPLTNPLILEQQQAQLCCGSDFSNALPSKFTSFGSGGSPTAEATGRFRLASSGGIHGSTSLTRPPLGTVTIPMKDILLVGMSDTESKLAQCQTSVTTASAGFFELTMDNSNGQLVLMAFLKANLPKNKISDLSHLGLPRSPSNLTQNTQSTKSFDVEAFTATRMTERLRSESVAEKVQRRIHRIVTSLEEISSSVAECGCGCGTKNNAAVSPAPAEKRDSPPYQSVEMAGSEHTSLQSHDHYPPYSSPTGARFEMKPSAKYKKRQDMLTASHLPSGLSVESDPEASTVSAVATTNGDRD